MKDKDIKHLEWVYERMKYVHNENENYDYMIRFREILEALRQPAVISSAFLVKMRWDYAPYDIVVFAKTDKGAIGKAKRKFPNYEILSAIFIRHCL